MALRARPLEHLARESAARQSERACGPHRLVWLLSHSERSPASIAARFGWVQDDAFGLLTSVAVWVVCAALVCMSVVDLEQVGVDRDLVVVFQRDSMTSKQPRHWFAQCCCTALELLHPVWVAGRRNCRSSVAPFPDVCKRHDGL
jgi:hypothetical protein